MANYLASVLLAAQTKFIPKFQESELRRKANPALQMALKNLSVTMPNAQDLRNSNARPVKGYIKKHKTATNGTTRTYNHTGGRGDSMEVTFVWATFSEPFSKGLKQAEGNVFNDAEMMAHEMSETAKILHDRIGTYAQTYLQSHRTQLTGLATGGNGLWSDVNFALEVAAEDSNMFFENAASFMRKRNYRGTYDLLADQIQYRKYRYIQNQGGSNAVNTSYTLQDYAQVAETTEAIDATYALGSALIMPAGTFAVLPWIPIKNRTGYGDYEEFNGGYGSVSDPLGTDLTFALHGYSTRSDDSANGGDGQDIIAQMEMSVDVAFVLPPLSTADESVVYEIVQAA